MKVLITGGSGFIGAHLIEKLSKNNDVHIMDFTEPLGKYKKFHKADITNFEDVRNVCKNGFDAIVHLAAKSMPRDLSNVAEFYDINVRGTINILEVARRCDVKKFIFASSSSVYGNTKMPQNEDMQCIPNSFYGASKLACESFCLLYNRFYGIDVSIPRFFTNQK